MINWKKQYDAKFWMEPLTEEIAMFETQKLVKKISGKESNYTIEFMSKENRKKNFINFRHETGIKEDSIYYYNFFMKKNFLNKISSLYKDYKSKEYKLRKNLFKKEKKSFNFFKNLFLEGYTLSKFTDPSMLKIFENRINNIVNEKLNNDKDLLLELNSTHDISTIKKEELELLELALLIKDKKKYEKKLNQIQYNYGFLSYVSKYEIISKKVYLDKAIKISKKSTFNIIKEINKIKTFSQKHLELKNYIYKNYNLSKEEIKLFEINSTLAHLRLELRNIWIPYYCEIHNFIKRLAKRNKIKKEILLSLRLKDFMYYLKTGILNQRKISKVCLLFKEKEKNYIFFNKEAKEMAKKFEIPLEIPKTNFLKGDIANKGKILEKVFVLQWDKDHKKNMKKMKKGDILVVTQTKPDMMEAIRKASGIITNEGGMISHAAIISREMKIPCLMNTKYATEIFKTGNIVSLDCINGEVKLK